MALTTHAQGGAPRQAQDGSTKRVVLAGSLYRRGIARDSLWLSLAFAGGHDSALVYGPGILIDLEVLAIAEDLHRRRGARRG